MSSNKTTITPARRRQLAMSRLLTNLRQLLQLDPSDEAATLIQQHTELFNAMYRHHVALTAQESATAQGQPSDTPQCSNTDTAASPTASPVVELPDTTSAAGKSSPHKSPHEVTVTETVRAVSTSAAVVRIPRKLKKKLSKLPSQHPLRRRYLALMQSSPLTTKKSAETPSECFSG